MTWKIIIAEVRIEMKNFEHKYATDHSQQTVSSKKTGLRNKEKWKNLIKLRKITNKRKATTQRESDVNKIVIKKKQNTYKICVIFNSLLQKFVVS